MRKEGLVRLGGIADVSYPIGEHIDYALFGVQPMAVESDILIACAPSKVGSVQLEPGHVVAQNLAKKYGPQAFAPLLQSDKLAASEDAVRAWKLDIDTKELHWESYVKAGYYVRTPPLCP